MDVQHSMVALGAKKERTKEQCSYVVALQDPGWKKANKFRTTRQQDLIRKTKRWRY